MKLKKKKNKGVTPEIKKAFALTSLIGALLMGNNTGELRLMTLHRQINAAMRVFRVKAGAKTYHGISAEVREMWMKLAEVYETSVTLDELPVVIEMMSMLIPPRDHKAYLGIAPYVSKGVANYDEVVSRVCHAVLDLDRRLDEAYGTKPYGMPISAKPKIQKADNGKDMDTVGTEGKATAKKDTSSKRTPQKAHDGGRKQLTGKALRKLQKNRERAEHKKVALQHIREIAQKARERYSGMQR